MHLKRTKKNTMFRINKLKPHFSKCKQFLDFAATAIIFVSLSLWSLTRYSSTISGYCRLLKCITL